MAIKVKWISSFLEIEKKMLRLSSILYGCFRCWMKVSQKVENHIWSQLFFPSETREKIIQNIARADGYYLSFLFINSMRHCINWKSAIGNVVQLQLAWTSVHYLSWNIWLEHFLSIFVVHSLFRSIVNNLKTYCAFDFH